MARWVKRVGLGILGLGLIIFGFVFATHWGSLKDTDYNHPPQFVTADFIDLAKVDTISKYRSGVGHDYSGNGETCRSMRHYFGNSSIAAAKFKNGDDKLKTLMPEPDPNKATEIYAPTDGWISSISGEGTPIGKQVEIVADKGQGWHIRIDHVFPLKGIHIFSKVKAGQLIGLIHEGQSVDMTVLYNYRGQMRLTSYFWVMTDQVFAKYQARGVKSRDEFILPKEVIDAHPWNCLNNRKDTPDFAEDYSGSPEGDAFNNVHLSGWIKSF